MCRDEHKASAENSSAEIEYDMEADESSKKEEGNPRTPTDLVLLPSGLSQYDVVDLKTGKLLKQWRTGHFPPLVGPFSVGRRMYVIWEDVSRVLYEYCLNIDDDGETEFIQTRTLNLYHIGEGWRPGDGITANRTTLVIEWVGLKHPKGFLFVDVETFEIRGWFRVELGQSSSDWMLPVPQQRCSLLPRSGPLQLLQSSRKSKALDGGSSSSSSPVASPLEPLPVVIWDTTDGEVWSFDPTTNTAKSLLARAAEMLSTPVFTQKRSPPPGVAVHPYMGKVVFSSAIYPSIYREGQHKWDVQVTSLAFALGGEEKDDDKEEVVNECSGEGAWTTFGCPSSQSTASRCGCHRREWHDRMARCSEAGLLERYNSASGSDANSASSSTTPIPSKALTKPAMVERCKHLGGWEVKSPAITDAHIFVAHVVDDWINLGCFCLESGERQYLVRIKTTRREGLTGPTQTFVVGSGLLVVRDSAMVFLD
ncbi:hypothetical protein HK102_000530 [Quaeritorhiza haematococci]|nr:hypothetical protein HK102_000530 [Quaeritorhiza haematococci]